MRYSIVYSSKTGNTKLLAESIKEVLDDEKCLYFGEPDIKALDADIIFVGYWTDKGCCDEVTKAFLCKIENKKLFLFGSAGFGSDNTYFDKVINNTKANISSSVEIIGTYMCQGKMPVAVRERYEKMKNNPNIPMDVDKLIANFDMALTHPDDKDIALLKDTVKLYL